MRKKEKSLLIILILLMVISIGFTFYKTIILQDFMIIESEE